MKTVRSILSLCCLALLALTIQPELRAQNSDFRRGDANGDWYIDISDAVFTLRYVFIGGVDMDCEDAGDCNDDGGVNLADASYSLAFVFQRGSAPPAPGLNCASDPTADSLSCDTYTSCANLTFDGPTDFETPIQGGGFLDDTTVEFGVPGAAPNADGDQGRSGDTASEPPDREVEESDLFKLDGDLLFALNRYRGLQKIDLADDASPALLNRLPLFGYPQEMYLRGDLSFVILTDYYRFWTNASDVTSALGFYGSQVVVADISGEEIEIVTAIDVEGFYHDSRLVGNILYLVTKQYSYHWGNSDGNQTQIVAIDISDPSNVRQVDSKSFPRDAWEHHIYVTPNAIYLSESGWDHISRRYDTTIRYIDIRDPQGSIRVRGQARVNGRVQDRWSMDEHQGVLRVASGENWGSGDVFMSSYLVTNPDLISRLDQYTLVDLNETVTAARFDASRGYIVTFRRIDPLFTFDLADPTNLRLRGELEMTGWLDHLVPRGDRLIALGHEQEMDPDGWMRTSLAVSIVDVSDFDNPVLADREVFEGVWGSLPGDRDDVEKVFRVIDEKGLILVPYRAWNPGSYRTLYAVQLLDVDGTDLTKRGLITDAGRVDRSFPHKDENVVTLSNEVLQVLDIADRDNPAVLGDLELSRNVINFAVLPDGEHSVQLSGDWSFGDLALSVTRLDDVNAARPLARVPLPAPSGRLFTNGSLVYVASLQDIWDAKGQSTGQETHVQVVDFTDPLTPVLRGSVTIPAAVIPFYGWWYWGQGDEVVQVNGSTLAFHSNPIFWWGCLACDALIAPGPWPSPKSNTIYVADMADADNPELASTIEVSDIDWAWGLDASGTILYISSYNILRSEDGLWIARYDLHRFDVAAPADPVELATINIPGMFVDATTDGRVIYTLENRVDRILLEEGGVWNWVNRNVFYALALQDDKAFLQSSVELPGWVAGVEVDGDSAFAVTQEWLQIVEEDRTIYKNRQNLLSIDISDPGDLNIAGMAEVPFDYVYLRKVEDDYAFLGSYAGIFVYDVSDVAAPTFAEFFRTQGWPQDIVLHEEKAYLPSGYYGVQVLDLGSIESSE